MKKRFIATILIATLIISTISGCGDSPQESATSVAQSEETPTEASPEILETGTETTDTEAEDTLETVTDNESAQEEDLSDTDDQEASEEFTVEDGMQKLALLFNARNELYLTDDPAIINLLIGAENLNLGFDNFPMNVTTSDGVSIDPNYDDSSTFWSTGELRSAVIANYLYNYVNIKQEYYDLYKYIETHTRDEIVNGDHDYSMSEDANSNNITMLEVSSVIEYLFENMNSLSAGEMLTGDDCTVEIQGEDVEYEIPILVNGNYIGARALFDADGNLLNIATFPEEGWKDEYYIDSEDTGWIVAQ